jgi:hypothetical protein
MRAEALFFAVLSGGVMVLAAGLYAVLFALGRLWRRKSLLRASYVLALLALLAAFGMITSVALPPFWQLLVGLSAVAYMVLPPVMWRVVTRLHRRYGPGDDDVALKSG